MLTRWFRYRNIFAISICTLILIFWKNYETEKYVTDTIIEFNETLLKGNLYCYRGRKPSLKDISDIKIPQQKSIFFHETSCHSYEEGKIFIKARQACAVESAARANPDFNVYLLYLSPGEIKNEGTESDRILQALLSYSNVKIYHNNIDKYMKNTPVEKLLLDGHLEQSKYQISHTSDVMRYLTLWKYGGVYLDLDVLILKSFNALPDNFAAAQYPKEMAAGFVGFSNRGIGRNFSTYCIEDLKYNFKGYIWGNNGPDVLARLARSLCPKGTNYSTIKTCQGFTIYPPTTFYAVPYPAWRKFFKVEYNKHVEDLLQNSFALHIWNKLSEKTVITLNSTVSYLTYAKQFCPKVIKELSDNF